MRNGDTTRLRWVFELGVRAATRDFRPSVGLERRDDVAAIHVRTNTHQERAVNLEHINTHQTGAPADDET
jgi:hypothetical protein